MIRYFSISFLTVLLGFITPELFSQYKLPFGDIALTELSNKKYQPDPGADAIIISDIGIATLNYENGYYMELERDVRIRIINSNGFDYANIEIPVFNNDELVNYRASTFNTRNDEKIETKIPKKSFITEKITALDKVLKFSFPDVHEGSVIEYSYIIRLKNNSVYELVPWKFQSDIPEIFSSITVAYPDAFTYKRIISGSANFVQSKTSAFKSFFFGNYVKMNNITWYTKNVPAFRDEPYILSKNEHLTKITFELQSVDFPGSSLEEITPTYTTLTKKLLERDDFGTPLKTDFRKLAEEITKDQKNNLSRLKKIHEYISSKILWNGVEDFIASSSLQRVLKKEKGNSAEINMILIAMLRSLNIKADPLILSTRSNGSLNQYSAMIQQFNYLVAYVFVDGEFYVVDATDPLRPFNVLPFDCLNGTGRLISENESKFVELNNNERQYTSSNLDITLDTAGNITGSLGKKYSDYTACDIRRLIKMESEEGYNDMVKSLFTNVEISDFKIENPENRDTDLTEKYKIKISNGAQVAGDEIIFNPYLSLTGTQNPFYSPERKFPINFGCPIGESYSLTINIPEGYSVIEKPENFTSELGQTSGKFEYRCIQTGNNLIINSELNIDQILFQPSDYSAIRSFYSKMLQKQAEIIIIKKNALIK